MVAFQSKVKRVGGSLVLAVPPPTARELGLREGETVSVVVPVGPDVGFGAYADIGEELFHMERDEKQEERRRGSTHHSRL